VESQNFISSPDFARVLQASLDEGFAVLNEYLRSDIFVQDFDHQDSTMAPTLRLADVLPGLARWSHMTIHGLPNELVERVGQVRELAGFSAIIFASYDDSLL